MSFIVDCSVAMAWVLQDEASDYADGALEQVVRDNAMVPDLWWLETRNVLLIAERRNRISREDADAADKALTDLGLIHDESSNRQNVLEIARKHDLTSYDAIYLETALRNGVLLATLDKKLAQASENEGILWRP